MEDKMQQPKSLYERIYELLSENSCYVRDSDCSIDFDDTRYVAKKIEELFIQPQPTHTIGIDELIGVLILWNYEYVGYEKDDKDEQTFKECAEQYLKDLLK